jgi:crotonobetainyl-CoA:carnitine CoA-transferase CaiB-like acyl-CoA transferase
LTLRETTLLETLKVLACDTHHSVRLCARFLAQAGATVEIADGARLANVLPGSLLAGQDVIVLATDTCPQAWRLAIDERAAAGQLIVCNISAFGLLSARAGRAWSDAEIQAISGLVDTTGFADDAPVRPGIPFAELSAAMYAATAVAAAFRMRLRNGLAQRVDVSLYASAVNALTTFLPNALTGRPTRRVGNRHPASAPWNAYPTRDGWVLICTSTDDQWRKLAAIAHVSDVDRERYGLLAERIEHVNEIDAIVETWTVGLSTDACLARCEEAGLAAGPIVNIEDLAKEPNFRYRHPLAAQRLASDGIDSESWQTVPLFRSAPLGETGYHGPGSLDANHARSWPDETREPRHTYAPRTSAPLAGVKVVELGQYTTAPLAGKHLAALGADVIKIEQPGGETARAWMPAQGETSYFFMLNNTGKRAIELDLKNAAGHAHFEQLIGAADVLIENLRPGALDRLGFARERLAQINPRLVYCSISGFGIDSAYPSRPAFDTVIQAMSGMMDLTRSAGSPVKTGISAADVLGGQAALFGVVAALVRRDDGPGACIEVSMQDVAALCALFSRGNHERAGILVSCADGHLWTEPLDPGKRETCAALAATFNCADRTRFEAQRALAQRRLRATPIAKVGEVVEDSDFLHDLLSAARDPNGVFWPVLKTPYRFTSAPVVPPTLPGTPATREERSQS